MKILYIWFRMGKAIVIFSIASAVLAYLTFRFVTEEKKVAHKSYRITTCAIILGGRSSVRILWPRCAA